MADYVIKRGSDSRLYVGINPETLKPVFKRASEMEFREYEVVFSHWQKADAIRERLEDLFFGGMSYTSNGRIMKIVKVED